MTPRQKNMLEAFQASSEVETTPPSEEEAPAPASAPPASRRAKSGLPDVSPELFAVVLCVLVIGSFFLGRWSVSTTVQAAEDVGTEVVKLVVETPASADMIDPMPAMDDEPAPESESEMPPVVTEMHLGTVDMLEANSVAFGDKENLVTVRVASYDNNESGRRRALQTGLYLSSLGFPAMIPVELGDNIFLCVGAAPSARDDELLRMMRELRQIPGPPPSSGPNAFADAYLSNIDKLIAR